MLVPRLSQLDKANLAVLKLLEQIAIGLNGILIEHILNPRYWGELASDLGGREVLEGEVDDLQEEPASVLCAASVVVGSSIGKGSQEGIQDVAVGTVNLNSIKASLLCQFERVLELVLHVLDIFQSCLLGDRIVNPRKEGIFSLVLMGDGAIGSNPPFS